MKRTASPRWRGSLAPRGARATPGAAAVGFLNGASAWEYVSPTPSFRQSLSETGYVEGRNIELRTSFKTLFSQCAERTATPTRTPSRRNDDAE
jgi:hypothetical protein